MAVTFNDAVSRAPMRPFQWITAGICMVVLIVDGIDMQLLGLVAPLVIEEMGVDRGSFGPAMSAALIGMAIGAWGGGWLGDRIGRRNSLALAAVVFGLATIGASQAMDVWSMAAWRVVGGLGFGAAFPNSLALASEWLPERWRPYAITTLSVGTPAGGAIVAGVADQLLDAFGWRGTFVVLGVCTLFLLVLIFGLLRDSPSFLMAKGERERAQRMARKVLREDVELIAERQRSVEDPRPAQGIGVFHSSNARLNWGVGIGFAASTMVAYGIINWVTTLLTVANFTLEQALRAASVGGMASIAGALAAGYLTRRFGSRRVMAGASLMLIINVLALGWAVEVMPAAPGLGYRVMVDALVGGVGCIVSVGIATIYVMITLGYPQSCRSAGIGFGMFAGRAGGILISFIGGWLIDLGSGSLLPFFLTLAVAAIMVSAAAFLVDRHVEPAGRA